MFQYFFFSPSGERKSKKKVEKKQKQIMKNEN